MSFDYDYGFSFDLKENCPDEVHVFFTALAEGLLPAAVPEVESLDLEVAAEEFVRLMAGAPAGLACGLVFTGERAEASASVSFSGAASADEFYMPFVALAEWLAHWSATEGCVGFYHKRSLLHPTLVYFHGGSPFMLQVTGTPTGLVDGHPMPHLDRAESSDELEEEDED